MNLIREYKSVQDILGIKRPVIFYAENRFYHQYFKELAEGLANNLHTEVCYITSDKNDPILIHPPSGIKTFYVYWWLAFLFQRLKARLVITSMTDLNNYAFRRSKNVDRYIYIFHAAVSTHLQYTQKAFFNYDAVFATGEYQEKEIRAAEKIHHLAPKEIIHYGYPLIESLEKQIADRNTLVNEQTPVILIAPSWFEGCIFDTCIAQLMQAVEKLTYNIVLRPHPEYVKRKKKAFAALVKQVGNNPKISIDYSADIMSSLVLADILITDRSGIAIEYALGIKKPVLFIETRPKIMNPDWEELGIEPLENQLRPEIGISAHLDEIDTIHQKIEQLLLLANSFPQKADTLKKNFLYDSKAGIAAGLNYINTWLR